MQGKFLRHKQLGHLVAGFLLLLEVIAFSGVSPSIHDPEADTVNLLGDFVNQTEQLYVYEN